LVIVSTAPAYFGNPASAFLPLPALLQHGERCPKGGERSTPSSSKG
jgi:hypothetical protein